MKRNLYQHRPVDSRSLAHIKRSIWQSLSEQTEKTPWRFSLFSFSLVRAFAVLVVILGGSFTVLNAIPSKVPFVLAAQISEADSQPVFTLTSLQKNYPLALLDESLSVSPALAFDVVEVDKDEFNVLLKEKPKPNVTYTFRVENAQKESHFAWTYQAPEAEEVAVQPAVVPVVQEPQESILPTPRPNVEDPARVEEQPEVLSAENAEEVAPVENPAAVNQHNQIAPEAVSPEPYTPLEEPTEKSAETDNTNLTLSFPEEPSAVVTNPESAPQEAPEAVTPVQTELKEGALVEAAATDVCVVNMHGFAEATLLTGSYVSVTDFGKFILGTGSAFDGAGTRGNQFFVRAATKVLETGENAVYYVQSKASVFVGGSTFTAYVQSDARLVGNGYSGTVYSEAGANLKGLGASTVYHECSQIVFLK